MAGEKIYTIPITEAMSNKCGCPLCSVEKKTKEEELKRILGASMMEPDIRIKTNKYGFCNTHFKALVQQPNKLSLALMLTTHLEEFSSDLFGGCTPFLHKTPDGKKQSSLLTEKREQCYLCSRMNTFMSAVCETFVYMYKTDESFGERIKEQPYFCVHHMRRVFLIAAKSLSKDQHKRFCADINEVNSSYAVELMGDLNWFCKKFDYRYKDEDWKNSKDAIERTMNFLHK